LGEPHPAVAHLDHGRDGQGVALARRDDRERGRRRAGPADRGGDQLPDAPGRGQFDTQTQRLHAYAAEHNLAVTATYSDIGSGTDPDRPGLAAMLDAARAGQFDHLLVDRLDRLARNITDLAAIFDDLDHAGITLHCAAEPSGIITITHDALAIIRLPAATEVCLSL
jgi:DNA invertase Pin-like site-specific DNA recombinase